MFEDQSLPKPGASDHQQESSFSQGNLESSSAPQQTPDQDDAWQQRIFVELRHTIEGIRRHLAATDEVMASVSASNVRTDALHTDLHELDSALPHQTFGEVLIACEALALVSGPSALVSGDVKTLHAQSRGLQATMLGILRASQAGSPAQHSDTPPTSIAQDTWITSLRQPATVADLLRMTELLGALAANTPSIAGIQVAAMPRRSLAPIFIIGLAIALIVFLAGSILIATSRIPPTQHSRNTGSNIAGNPIGDLTPTATSNGQPPAPTATSNGQPPAPTATSNGQPPAPTATSNGQPPAPTATSNGQPPAPTATSSGQPPAPTATPVPPPPPAPTPTQAPVINVSLSAQSLQLCPDNDVTITYNSGTGVITWTMTVSDSTNIGVQDVDGAPYNPAVSGQLAPGQSVDVAVKALNDGNFSGVLTLHIPGIHDQYVSYQTNCLSSGN